MKTTDKFREVRILMVEDNPGDVRLTKELLDGNRLVNTLSVVSDGASALDRLHRRGKFREAERPDLVLLDLNIPIRNGFEVLADLKQDEELKKIPVVVLTGSRSGVDVARSYDLEASAYLTKPVDPDDFLRVIRSVGDFRLEVVTSLERDIV